MRDIPKRIISKLTGRRKLVELPILTDQHAIEEFKFYLEMGASPYDIKMWYDHLLPHQQRAVQQFVATTTAQTLVIWEALGKDEFFAELGRRMVWVFEHPGQTPEWVKEYPVDA